MMAYLRAATLLPFIVTASAALVRSKDAPVDVYALRTQVLSSDVVKQKIAATCEKHQNMSECEAKAGDALFCELLSRSHKELASEHCGAKAAPAFFQMYARDSPAAKIDVYGLRNQVLNSLVFQDKVKKTCATKKISQCEERAEDALFCELLSRSHPDMAAEHCSAPAKSQASSSPAFLQVGAKKAPEDELAKEMTHDLEMNFNKIAPFGKEDTAKELQDHAAKTQDTLVDAVENAEVAEIKRAVFRALTRLRAATIKEFDTIARLETQAIDAYNDAHHYRAENPLAHLHEDEAPVETDKLKSFH
jgi:hypothetical protein